MHFPDRGAPAQLGALAGGEWTALAIFPDPETARSWPLWSSALPWSTR
jgi:hypothetical protein